MNPQTSGLSFDQAVLYNSGGYFATSVAAADLNGDGKLDAVLANLCTSAACVGGGLIDVLLGRGDGTFQTALSYNPGGYYSVSITIADVNGDGKPDLVVLNGCSTSECATTDHSLVGILLGNGDGTFQDALTYSSGGEAANAYGPAAVADVNGDGKPDIIVANYNYCGSSCTTDGSVGVLLGNGDGTFQPVMTYDSGGIGATSAAVTDVNGDGKPDVVVANICSGACTGSGDVGVLLGNGDGTFQAAVIYPSGGIAAVSVAVADINGDGRPDIAVANECVTSDFSDCDDAPVGVLLGNGDGTFQPAVVYDPRGIDVTWFVVFADVNGDGKLDLVTTSQTGIDGCCDGYATVFLGNGDGTFGAPASFDTGDFGAHSVAVGDVNGDGKADLMISNTGYSTSSVGVLINTSHGPTTTALASSLNPSALGQSVTFTATVTSQVKGKLTGTVNFFDGKTSLGQVVLSSSGVAMLSTSTLAVGTHSITSKYNGDANFLSSTSQVLSQVVQGAIAQITPTSINFGNQTVGMGSNQGPLVTLTNTGNVAMTITSIGITGADGADYSVEGTCPSPLAAGGGACTLAVSFVPTTTGTRTAALTFTDSAPNSPQAVSLTGVGVLPAVSLAPSSLTFSTQIVFTSSKTQTVTLTNTGVGTLSITNTTITGPFTQTNNCGTTVHAGGTCTFTVTFTPTKSGTATGSLSITDNAPLSPQTVSLKGTGTDIQFNPVTFNFGNQPIGTKSLPKKITLSNKASVAVNITKISLTGADAADFSETNTCGTKLEGGASCFITVTFTPSVRGTRTAAISVTDNGGGSPQTAGLSGTGT